MGAIGLILTTKMGIVPAFLGQIVYLPGDTIKYLIAVIIAKRLKFINA
ncbi:hypothetical protein [Streptococcus massiliensis]|nr:hypothetical protein [Streptococcus massiliensis]